MDRKKAWKKAKKLVDPIVELHGLQQIKGPANFLGSSSEQTPVDQHIGHILTVAEWLLEGE
jgi:hypothetical protein